MVDKKATNEAVEEVTEKQKVEVIYKRNIGYVLVFFMVYDLDYRKREAAQIKVSKEEPKKVEVKPEVAAPTK